MVTIKHTAQFFLEPIHPYSVDYALLELQLNRHKVATKKTQCKNVFYESTIAVHLHS